MKYLISLFGDGDPHAGEAALKEQCLVSANHHFGESDLPLFQSVARSVSFAWAWTRKE